MPSIWFARHDFPDDDLNQVAIWGEGQVLSKRNDYVSISLTNLKIPEFDGLLRQYTWTSESSVLGKTDVRCEDLNVLKNRAGYTLSFCSEDKDWQNVQAVFQQMMDSFKLR
jgi:hypothetical protein